MSLSAGELGKIVLACSLAKTRQSRAKELRSEREVVSVM